MSFRQFTDVSNDVWDKYLRTIARLPLELADGGSLLYPNIALFVRTNRHYILELFGNSEVFNGLSVKTHEEPNIYKYLYQFEAEEEFKPLFFTTEPNIITDAGIIDFVLGGPEMIEKFEKRFEFIQHYKQGTILKGKDTIGPLFRFGEGLQEFFLSRCILLNSLDNAYRAKYINYMEIVSSSYNLTEYRKTLEKRLVLDPKSWTQFQVNLVNR
jgi:hypothetical protein